MPCEACGAPLWFCWTKDGRQMPVNPEPPPDEPGNVVCIIAKSGNGMAVIPISAISDEYREFVEPHARTSHFADCPRAEHFRKREPS